MKELKLYFIIYLLFGFANLQGQLVKCFNCIDKPVYKGDSVALNIPSFYGDLQWQKSIDLQSWSNLEDATSGMLAFVADSSAYYRARVLGGTCDPVYSDTMRSTVFRWNQWADSLPQTIEDLYSTTTAIDMAKDSSIWLLDFGTMYKTINKGINWQSTLIYGNSISAFDSLHAWICSADSGVLSTIDGGKSWTVINYQMTQSYYIHFFNLNEGLIVRRADMEQIYATKDGGSNWSKIDISFREGEITSSGFGNDGIQYRGDTICLSTTMGRMLMSYDKGYDWKWINTGLNDSVRIISIAMRTSNSFGFISRGINWNDPVWLGFTTDAGAHWTYNFIDLFYLPHIFPVFGKINGYLVTNPDLYNTSGTWYIAENGLSLRKLDDRWIENSISIGPDRCIGFTYLPNWNCDGHCIPPPKYIVQGKFSLY
jgi:Photosynthesis system II assembly factor YCF48